MRNNTIPKKANLTKDQHYQKIIHLANGVDWKVLSKCYINRDQHMEFECSAGHIISVIPRAFENKQICRLCSTQTSKQEQYNKIVDKAKSIGWKVISEKYDIATTCMIFSCSNNHRLIITPDSFRVSQYCDSCKNLEKYGELNSYVNYYGWEIITENYVDNTTAMKFMCKAGHVRFADSICIRKTPECSQCLKISKKQEQYNDIVVIAEEQHWKVVSKEYINSYTAMGFVCPNGHQRNITPQGFLKYLGCADCSNVCSDSGERNFRINIEILGGKILGTYVNCDTRVECLCSSGALQPSTDL